MCRLPCMRSAAEPQWTVWAHSHMGTEERMMTQTSRKAGSAARREAAERPRGTKAEDTKVETSHAGQDRRWRTPREEHCESSAPRPPFTASGGHADKGLAEPRDRHPPC